MKRGGEEEEGEEEEEGRGGGQEKEEEEYCKQDGGAMALCTPSHLVNKDREQMHVSPERCLVESGAPRPGLGLCCIDACIRELRHLVMRRIRTRE
jgi:hypothetical protein